ncbi:histamine H2 receptor-like [Protopterus annectens]|uniref:histamine H2 receptor-like n=1 Tax=Protopterus annectens TaxID=7888 RepID=UPI001CFB70C0|nr:histamine H2 receptor-like [Protopterus annectens]
MYNVQNTSVVPGSSVYILIGAALMGLNASSAGSAPRLPALAEELDCCSGTTRTIKIGIISVLGALIIVGNSAVVLVIASSVSGWSNNSRYFLLSLTCADAALALVVVPLNLYGSLIMEPPDDDNDEDPAIAHNYCHIVAFLNSSVFASSIYSLATVSLERYIAVFFPLRYRMLLTPTRLRLVIAAVWVLPPLFLFPISIPQAGVMRVTFSRASLICNPDYSSNVPYSLLLTALIFFPCSAVVTFANLRLWFAARRQQLKSGRTHVVGFCGSSWARRRQGLATRVLLPVVIVYYICWAPCMFTILYNAITQKHVPEWVEFVALWLPSGNGFLNCIVYFWLNRSFRQKFQQLGQKLCWSQCFNEKSQSNKSKTKFYAIAVVDEKRDELQVRSCSMSSTHALLPCSIESTFL